MEIHQPHFNKPSSREQQKLLDYIVEQHAVRMFDTGIVTQLIGYWQRKSVTKALRVNKALPFVQSVLAYHDQLADVEVCAETILIGLKERQGGDIIKPVEVLSADWIDGERVHINEDNNDLHLNQAQIAVVTGMVDAIHLRRQIGDLPDLNPYNWSIIRTTGQ